MLFPSNILFYHVFEGKATKCTLLLALGISLPILTLFTGGL